MQDEVPLNFWRFWGTLSSVYFFLRFVNGEIDQEPLQGC